MLLQIAPIYLTSCIKQGMGLLEILLYKQPVDHNQLLLKVIDSSFSSSLTLLSLILLLQLCVVLCSSNHLVFEVISIIDGSTVFSSYAELRDLPPI